MSWHARSKSPGRSVRIENTECNVRTNAVALVEHQSGQHVTRQFPDQSRIGSSSGEQISAPSDRWQKKLDIERSKSTRSLRSLCLTISRVMRQRRPLYEQHEVVVQAKGFVSRPQRSIDPRSERSEVHHQLMTQGHKLGATGADMRSQRCGHNRREELALVTAMRVLAEQTVFKATACPVLRPMEVHQDIAHHHIALVIERLAQVLAPKRLTGIDV